MDLDESGAGAASPAAVEPHLAVSARAIVVQQPGHMLSNSSFDAFIFQEPYSEPSKIEKYEGEELTNKKPSLPFPSAATDPSLAHLREISSLASWTVSSYKPGCGVAALLQPTTGTFWQSDGPQPHLLNVHFFKLVRIVKLRVYLDFELDESYTPTRLAFAAGTHEYDAVEFAEWRWQDAGPKGWVDVDLSSCGTEDDHQQLLELTGPDGDESTKLTGVLRCFFLQIRVLENHQNGKDTHIRGVQIFARDDRVKQPVKRDGQIYQDREVEKLRQGLEEADWMGEPELR